MVRLFKNTMQSHSSVSVNQIISLVSGFPCIGFSGSRHSTGPVYNSALQFLPVLSNYKGSIGVGCAKGIDGLVRNQFSFATVIKVQPPINRRAFAVRSTKLVHWLASLNSLLVAFPSTVSPSAIVPSTSFKGYGSGTWGTIALSIGMGLPVLLFIHNSLGSNLPVPNSLGSHFTFHSSSFNGSWWLTF